MRLALIGDIHSNVYALQSVLEHIETQDVDAILCAGDLVGYLPFPNKVIELLRNAGVVCVQGNHDERIAKMERETMADLDVCSDAEVQAKASARYTNAMLTQEHHAFLRYLPTSLTLTFEQYSLLLVHGSPNSNTEYVYEDSDVEPWLQETSADIIVCAHTHIPYHREVGGKTIINTGSVGKPKIGKPEANYIVLDCKESIETTIHSIPYDVEAMVKAIENNRMIANELIPALREGR
ncbi:MAG: metallophosphoesterase family protein [Erysipelotrichaceae bacterium]